MLACPSAPWSAGNSNRYAGVWIGFAMNINDEVQDLDEVKAVICLAVICLKQMMSCGLPQAL